MIGFLLAMSVAASVPPSKPIDLGSALAAPQDLWGEMARANGDPSFRAFADLIPPLRYVNAAFRHYPIVLSAPRAINKARLISNGSGVNLPGKVGTWQDSGLCPVAFGVGNEAFGEDLARLDGPKLDQGWLPICTMAYSTPGGLVRQEAFAAVDVTLGTQDTVVCVRFTWLRGRGGVVTATLPDWAWRFADGHLSAQDKGWVVVDAAWQWDDAKKTLTGTLVPGRSVVLAIASAGAKLPNRVTGTWYDKQRRLCRDHWTKWLKRGAAIQVPEPRVNDAYRALLVGTQTLAHGDVLNYSALNSYATTFQAECGDAARALALFGIGDSTAYAEWLCTRPHSASWLVWEVGFRLQMLAQLYWLDRDSSLLDRQRELWTQLTDQAIGTLDPASGLAPKEGYCGDIATLVHNLPSNANFWRGLRDVSAALADAGQVERARYLGGVANRVRTSIRRAVADSVVASEKPPFVPVALFGAEKPYAKLTESMLGSYWNLMAPYVLGSGVFGPSGPESQWIIATIQQRGGLCMGLTRFDQHSGLFANVDAVDDLYGLRLALELLRRDEVGLVLTSFYGKLAQGMTRDTFVGGEGTGLRALDDFGRPMYLPPNCSANAYFLQMLRYLLIQDWDMDDDGRPDTLRLLFATPRAWLRDGARLHIERAPTAFGPVALDVRSKLSEGLVEMEIAMPLRAPRNAMVRLRLPAGWRIESATIESSGATSGPRPAKREAPDTISLTDLRGKVRLTARVRGS